MMIPGKAADPVHAMKRLMEWLVKDACQDTIVQVLAKVVNVS